MVIWRPPLQSEAERAGGLSRRQETGASLGVRDEEPGLAPLGLCKGPEVGLGL